MASFKSFLQKKFDVGELDRRSLIALSCEIDQVQNPTVIVSQSANISSIDMACLQAHRQNKGDIQASPANVQAFQRILEQMLYIERKTNPVLLYHASAMACKTLDLHVLHLKELHSTLTHTSATTPTPLFKSTNEKGKVVLERYSDAALGKRLTNPYDGRLDFIIFRRYEDTVHPIHWGPHKLRWVARRSATAEIQVAAKTDTTFYNERRFQKGIAINAFAWVSHNAFHSRLETSTVLLSRPTHDASC